MIRQAVETTVISRKGLPSALVAKGFPCAEHERGFIALAEALGFHHRPGEPALELRRARKTTAWFRRRAALLAPRPGTEVLTLGRFAGHSRKAQELAILESPSHFENFVGTLGGKWTNTTALAIEEPFMDLMDHSDLNLAVAFDGKDALVGGDSVEARGVVRWLAGLFESGTARLMAGRKLIVFCEPSAAFDLEGVDFGGTAFPEGYEARRLRCDWQPRAQAA